MRIRLGLIYQAQGAANSEGGSERRKRYFQQKLCLKRSLRPTAGRVITKSCCRRLLGSLAVLGKDRDRLKKLPSQVGNSQILQGALKLKPPMAEKPGFPLGAGDSHAMARARLGRGKHALLAL